MSQPNFGRINFNSKQFIENKQLLDFDEKDDKNLRKILKNIDKSSIVDVIDVFYDKLLQFEYPKSFFTNEIVLERIKIKQKQYFEEFFTAEHDEDFFKKRMQLGMIHERIGLDNNWYLASYSVFLSDFIDRMAKNNGGKIDPEEMKSLSKLMLMDIGAVITSYITAREQIINSQATEVLELSSPVLKLTDDIIVIPLLGTLDSARAFQIMEKILLSIEKSDARVVIIDITGVPLIDTATGANLVRTVKAIRLMGSESILTGVRPMLAQTIVELGIDLNNITTRNNLADGFIEALKLISNR